MNRPQRAGRLGKGVLGVILPVLALNVAGAAEPGLGVPAQTSAPEFQPWTLVTPAAAFSPRDSAKGCVFNGKMWLNNGYYHGNVNIRDLWSSEDGQTWTLALSNTPCDIYAQVAGFKGKLWAIKQSVWSSPDGVTWTRVLEKGPFGGCAELFVFRDRMWAFDGTAFWTTADGENWERVAGQMPASRGAFALAVHDDHLWVMGGVIRVKNEPPEKGYPERTTLNDVWRTADGITWEAVLKKAPWAPRQWFKAASYKGRLWIFGGFDNVNRANLSDVWSTTDGLAWERFTPDAPWTPRHEPTLFLFQDSVFLVAGNSWPVRNDVWRLKLP